ncbi:hypothetical protein [Bradyrhizobium sp. JR3.5]
MSDGKVRDEIHLLLTGGLKTEVFPRADSHEQVQAIVSRLKAAGNELKTKLVIAGFTRDPIIARGDRAAV